MVNGRNTQIVDQIVGRLHVGASRREVLSAVYHALPKRYRGRSWRWSRHALLRYALLTHKDNQRTYRHVTGGIQ